MNSDQTSDFCHFKNPNLHMTKARSVATAFLMLTASAVFAADEPATDLPKLWAANKTAAAETYSAPVTNTGTPEALQWGSHKSYIIPALDIVGFDFLLNRVDRNIYGCCDYNSNLSSIKRNLHSGWVVDSDGFTVNQLGHPYQGSMYHGFARSSGLTFGESLGYTFAGSAFWEISGETTPPSKNDQIMTGIGGSFLGEPLFRIANLILENDEGAPRLWREVAATAVSPSTGFNRLAFGDRFKDIFPSHSPAYYSRVQTGVSSTTQSSVSPTANVKRTEGLLDFSIDYGLPGKPGYSYDRAFDYFNMQAIASTAGGVESVDTRGLLIGKDYEAGPNYRGVWGLYGRYDYFSPQLFRVSSTGLSLGTTGQLNLSDQVELQGTALLGAGYTAVGTINDAANTTDNHYGVSPQALLAMHFIFGNSTALDFNVSDYFVSRLAAGSSAGHDNIVRADASLTYRIYKQHAVAIKYLVTRRDENSAVFGSSTESRSTIGIYYTLLGFDRFGAVDWH